MERKPEEMLEKAVEAGTSGHEWQEMLSLFHRNDLEYRVKLKMMDILENREYADQEGTNWNKLFQRIWNSIEEKENGKKISVFRLNTWLKVAAALVFGLIIGSLVLNRPEKTEPVYYTAMAPKGSVSQMILPDSTFICLNSASTLKYTYNNKEQRREIYLEGEAWFQVHPSENKTFVVHTGYYDVKVTGTEFNVKAYPEDREVVTTLEKGKVEIISGPIKLRESVSLKTSEQLTFNKESREITIHQVNTKWYTSWMDNKIIFVNMNLRELVVLLERKYGVDIRVDDPKILDYHYDGTLKNETILEVMDLLSETLPVRYTIKHQTIEIVRK